MLLRTTRVAATRPIDSLRVQGAGMLAVSLLLPLLAVLVGNPGALRHSGTWITAAGASIAAITALIAYRKVTAFPGTRGFAYVLPTYCLTFGSAGAMLLFTRLNYSGLLLSVSFVGAILFAFALGYMVQRGTWRSFYLVPFGDTGLIENTRSDRWVIMTAPEVPSDRKATIVADLRADHPPEWERMLAHAAIGGHAVYHFKQLRESLTGKVEIEHLSENSFGSLVPNLAYRKLKRVIDCLAVLAIVPILAVPLLVIALLVKLDSRGPIIFSQERMGFRGRTFRVLKFRTMRQREAVTDEQAARTDAITQSDDARITRTGRFLRRSRLDELPQFLNVLRGEMSIIGPRPEAVSLSRWYEEHLPFYVYRHIVRPGITGWAQVNQGHVADLGDVHVKLHYDFYYIKNFSAWLDLLITLRTVAIMLTGFGSK